MNDLDNYNKQIIDEMECKYRNNNTFPECEKLLLFLHSLFVITGQWDVMFSNAFVEEAIHLLKNALFLYRDGLYDCAFYSVREAHEVINNMLYLTKDTSMKKNWKDKKYFPMDKKLRDKLKRISADYKEIRDIIPEYFTKQECLIEQANKIIHKQGFDTFYRARKPYADNYGFNKEIELNLFLDLEKYTIGLLLIVFILIDPICLALIDPDVTYRMNMDPMTEPIDIRFFEDYLNDKNIVPKIMTSNFYKNFISAFDNYEEMSPAIFDIIRNQFFDVNALDEIEKQIHLIKPMERIMFCILKSGIQISNFYMLDGLDWYITSIPCNRKTISFNSEEFKNYASADYRFNQKRDNVYISVLKVYNNDNLFLEHNEPLEQEEIEILEDIEFATQEDFMKLFSI